MAASTQEEHNWMHVIVRVGLNACTHPIEYAKILIQIGHEPLPPYKSRTIFGREKLFYPSIFSYIRYIKSEEGFFGCYRGLTPKIIGNVVGGIACERVAERIQVKNDAVNGDDLTLEERTMRFVQRTARDTAGRVACIVVSQPFQVIAVRTMAEFVGHDGKYTGVLSSIVVIYEDQGLLGFFAGMVPRIIGEVGCLWLANTLIHIANNFIVEDKDVQSYVGASIKFLSGALWYPMQVVSSCMTISGSGMVAGSPPRMPEYTSWMDCYRHLKSTNCLKRGGTLLWRAYTGPTFFSASGAPMLPRPDILSKIH
ncbi:Mitochondrial substrate/solute carrier [Trinorchestia longiramus]|nr:Mitochondrial substrate/solute carrier [Trinorchestia longiramus]